MSAPSPPRPVAIRPGPRSDARRNRAHILQAAECAVAEIGTAVSLAEIAHRAGVGAGTVHRHFPTKSALLEAVLQQRIERLTTLAVRYRSARVPGAAFFDFCFAVVSSCPGNPAMCELLETQDGWPKVLLRGAGARFEQALQHLLLAAQRHGSARTDLTVTDVLAIFTGCVAIQRLPDQADPVGKVVIMMLDAMRASALPPVTKVAANPQPPERPDVVDACHHCQTCGAPLQLSGAGRPPRYCSAACRQKAHRQRSRAAQ